MNLQFTQPLLLALLIPAALWTLWLALRSDVSLTPWRRWVSTGLRLIVVVLLIMSLAGMQWKQPQEGMNTFFLLDRSDSIPSAQQEQARDSANKWAKAKKLTDNAGFLVFGTEAALETTVTKVAEAEKIQAVVGGERTDIAGAIRLGTAAFPEAGQKRLVLFSDGNENIGDAMSALLAAKPLGVSLDVVPLGVERSGDVSVQKLGLPTNIKKGQTFEAKIFAVSDKAQPAKVRLYRNDQLLGEQKVQLDAGKNLFSFPQTLADPGFYGYQVQIEVEGDTVPQNNKASSFVSVRGDPRVLVVSSDPEQDRTLAAALRGGKLDVILAGVDKVPATLAEMQSYDEIVLSNVAAGDLGRDLMQLLESAVRDFGIGLVVIGGDQAFAAGGYRHTPLEEALPLDMELSSKKVLPKGALGLVMHGMEFANGNQVARDIGIAALDALGPQDEMGVWLWDGTERALFDLQAVGDKRKLANEIAGMNQGDLPSFQGLMTMADEALKKSTANIKHLIVFSDGDPNAPSDALMKDLAGHKITVSTVMIGGHVQPTTMIKMAELGNGRFYDVKSAAQLPQIFIKEAAVILKSAIIEDPFKPQLAAPSELVRGIGGAEWPTLRGYVATTGKPRAEVPLVSDKGDPILAHWQFGLGRTVAFTSDARPKWAQDWMGWGKYQQFWSQTVNWALRRVDTADFNTAVSVDNGQGTISVEALDAQGNYRNFLNLQTAVVSPKGERVMVNLEQSGPGRYEAKFPTKEVGAYLLNLQETRDGKLVGSQVLGASVNYSPEFNATEPNLNLLRRLAEAGGGRILDPTTDNPFLLGRLKTFQPHDLWEGLLKLLVILFVLDVGVRRVDIDREEWSRWWSRLLGLGDKRKGVQTQESLGNLLATKGRVRSGKTSAGSGETVTVTPSPDLFRPKQAPPAVGGQGSTPPASPDAPADPAAPAVEPTSATSRLLEAKKRAQRKP
ncbi:MAG TPA: glutamine amidotransferase [Candidatus Limnocylindria bacterium]|nr:glutamine amidotransferase [Candidatus Limnocylindria bacterium]